MSEKAKVRPQRIGAPRQYDMGLIRDQSTLSGSSLRRSLLTALGAATLALALLCASLAAETITEADADALLAKGRALVQQEDFLSARAPFEQAVAAYRQLGLSAEEAETRLALGELLTDLAQYEAALDHLSQALAISLRLGDRKTEAAARGKLGRLSFLLARYPKASELYGQPLSGKPLALGQGQSEWGPAPPHLASQLQRERPQRWFARPWCFAGSTVRCRSMRHGWVGTPDASPRKSSSTSLVWWARMSR